MEPVRFRSLQTLGSVTTVLLAGNAGLAALGLLISLWVDSGAFAASVDEVSEESYLAAAGLIGLLAVVIFVGTIVSFCMLVHRAATNLRAVGRTGLQFTPGWAVGWFFVPFANLVKPFHAMKEIVLASDPDTQKSEYGTTWMTNPLPAIVNVWWGFWVTRMIVDRALARVESFELEVASVVVEFIAVTAAILLVQTIVRRQEALGGEGTRVRLAREMGHVAESAEQR